MYIYGGYDIREGPINTLWCFDVSNVGHLQEEDSNTNTLRWQDIQTKGVQKPGAICNHTCVFYRSKMYLFGGGSGMTTNETFYAFDALSNLWEPVRTKPF